MLNPIAAASQINKMAKQFKPEMVTNQNHLQWDPDNNCIHQAASNMIGKALQDYPVYNLTLQTSRPPMVVTTTPLQNPPTNMGGQTQLHQPNQTDTDSLANSNLSQGMWFTTTTTQPETLATWQEKLEKQTQERFETILLELSKMCRDMQNYNDPNKYGKYKDPNQAFSPSHMEEDESTQYSKSLLH